MFPRCIDCGTLDWRNPARAIDRRAGVARAAGKMDRAAVRFATGGARARLTFAADAAAQMSVWARRNREASSGIPLAVRSRMNSDAVKGEFR